jgi:chromosomal replication initiation ATPase DnaA
MTPEIYAGLFKKNIPIGKLTKATILKTVCIELEMEYESVKNKKTRLKEYAYARHLYCYFCRVFTNESLQSIGTFIFKNHTTVLHSKNTIANWRETDSGVDILCKKLNNAFKSKVVNYTENQRNKISQEIINKYK